MRSKSEESSLCAHTRLIQPSLTNLSNPDWRFNPPICDIGQRLDDQVRLKTCQKVYSAGTNAWLDLEKTSKSGLTPIIRRSPQVYPLDRTHLKTCSGCYHSRARSLETASACPESNSWWRRSYKSAKRSKLSGWGDRDQPEASKNCG